MMRAERDVSFFENMIKYSLDMVCSIDRDGCFVYVSDACNNILGYSSEELVGRYFLDIVSGESRKRTRKVAEETLAGLTATTFENECIHSAGYLVPMQWSMVWSEQDKVAFCTGRDVAEQTLAKKMLREKDDLYQALIEHSSDMLALFSKNGTYLYNAGSTFRDLGYDPEMLVGTSAFDLVHPDDLEGLKSSLKLLLSAAGSVKKQSYRYKSASGEWRWLESTLNNQLHNPYIKAVVANSQDVTENRRTAERITESKQQFRSLFENNPEMIVTENSDALILDINHAGELFTSLNKEDIIGRPLSDFITGEAAEICLNYLNQAFEGHTSKFELELTFEQKGDFVLEVTKIPVVLDGKVVMVHSVIKDITALTHSHNLVKQQASKLHTILDSIKDALCILDCNWVYTYTNKQFHNLLGRYSCELIGKCIWDYTPDGTDNIFYQQYSFAMETGQAVYFEAFSHELEVWLSIRAFPSDEGLLVYFNDITEKVRSQKELEKLSLVASNTTNGVIITDPERRIEWVNKGFSTLTGYSHEDAVGKIPSELLHHPKSNTKGFELVKEKMIDGEPVAFEIMNKKKSGEDVWLSVQVNPIHDGQGNLVRYITTQTDITALKKSELELSELTKDLFKHNRDMQQFTYIVSHNLRAPVANILGLSNMLCKLDRTTEVYDKSLENLSMSVQRLDAVLKDLNVILSIRDNQHILNKEKIDLGRKCQQVLESLKEPLQACGGEINIDIKEGTCVSGNGAYLYSIFYNLFSNAIKYRAADRPLQVSVKLYGETKLGTFVSVTDNGTGLDMKLAGNSIFKLYKRFHTYTEGRGIGLFLTKTHLEAMGGNINVNSQLGVGTRFLLQLV